MLNSAVVVSVVLCVCTAQTQVQEVWHRSEISNPQVDVEKCGRYQKSMICDPNNILEQEHANQLDDLIEMIANSTECPCSGFYCEQNPQGYRIAIALVPHMRWDMEAEGKKRPEDAKEEDLLDMNLQEAQKFSYTLLTKWSPGQCNEDVIIFYSLYDNVLYTTTGSQAKKALTDTLVADIAVDHREYFSPSGNIFEGLRNLIADYKLVFDGKYKARQMSAVTPDPAAVMGSGGHSVSLTSVCVMCVAALLSLLMLY